MRNRPNMNMVLIFSQFVADDLPEKLILLIRKPIDDFSDAPCERWLWDGKHRTISKKLNLRQRVVFCDEDSSEAIFTSIMDNGSVCAEDTNLSFSVPKITKKNEFSEYFELDAWVFYNEDANYIPHELLLEYNCNQICGYSDEENEYIEPLGLLTPSSLHNILKMGQIALKLNRKVHIRIRGIEDASGCKSGCIDFIGFVQDEFADSNNSIVQMWDKPGERLLGEGFVEKQTGIYRLQLNEFVSEGELRYFRNDELISVLSFSLILDISINTQIVNNILTDAYKRQFNTTEHEFKENETFTSKSWFIESCFKGTNGFQILCDYFLDIFAYLGTDIIVLDPYYMGSFSDEKSHGKLKVSDDQIAFVNAMLVHSFRNKWKARFTILGSNPRAYFRITLEYPQYLKYLSQFKVPQLLCPNLIEFRYVNRDFHGRYFLKKVTEDGRDVLTKPIIVTNSIGHIKEVDFMAITDHVQGEMVSQKCLSLYHESLSVEEEINGII